MTNSPRGRVTFSQTSGRSNWAQRSLGLLITAISTVVAPLGGVERVSSGPEGWSVGRRVESDGTALAETGLRVRMWVSMCGIFMNV